MKRSSSVCILGQILDLDLSLMDEIFKNIFQFWRKNSNILKVFLIFKTLTGLVRYSKKIGLIKY